MDPAVNLAAADLKPASVFLFVCFQVWFGHWLLFFLLVFIITLTAKREHKKEEMLTTLSSCVRHAVPGRSESREKVRGEKKKGRWEDVLKRRHVCVGGRGKNKGNRGEGEEDVVHTFVNNILQNCDTKLHIQ